MSTRITRKVVGNSGTYESFPSPHFVSKVVAPRNPKIVREDEEDIQLIPSAYLETISMTTEERLANTHTMRVPKKLELLDMGDTTHQKISVVSIDEPLFQPYPSEIFFQQFEPFRTYEVPLILENNDRVPRLIKMRQENSPYFKVISPSDVSHKVAPGLSITFRIQFTPDENKDYNHEIICISEREKYVVPVKAIGARGIVDFPDEVHFSVCPVQMTSTKTILARNIGNKEAKFSLITQSPFSVSPAHGNIAVHENCQITLEFFPDEVGNHQGQLILKYNTGETIFIALHAAAQDINIQLDKSSIRIESTFISLANQRSVLIHNKTDVVATYKWSMFSTNIEEEYEKSRFINNIDRKKEIEAEKFFEECVQDPTLRNKLSVLNRSFLNRRKLIEDSKGLFVDDVFKIDPVEGEIWPNQSMAVNIIFKPLEAKTYTKTAFCEITGRQNRLPLQLRGDGKGPELQLSVNIMDIGPIFIGSFHYYEVVLANRGEIDAIYNVKTSESVFGSCFTFSPNEGIVMPRGHQAIQVTFQGTCLGDFDEIYEFQVDGLADTLKLNFRGSVIGPTFHFDLVQLDFGSVSYGFQYTKKFQMHNTSLVPMTFQLHVPGDGIVDSVLSTNECISPRHADNSLPTKEFQIIPSEGRVDAMSSIQLTVHFVSNTVRQYDMALVVDVIDVAEQVFSLPIKARCLVPKVVVSNPNLTYNHCFLNYPYIQYVKLQNISNLPARYDLQQQEQSDAVEISYYSSEPSGIIQPFSYFDVPLTIEARQVNDLIVPAFFKIFGSPSQISVEISCFGQGAVVYVTELEVDWGMIPVLVDTNREVTLLNMSPIPANFVARMRRSNSMFRVNPSRGEISPEGKLTLTLTAKINDTVRFEDKVKVQFENSSDRCISVSAVGEGSTIVADPPLTPILNLGPHFSNQDFRKKFVFTNKGRRQQQVNWIVASNSSALPKINGQNTRKLKRTSSMEEGNSTFKLVPHRFKLLPGESIPVYLEGFIDSPADINEALHCYSIIGKQGGKKLIMTVNIQAQFINPLLSFSTSNIFFRTDKTPDMELEMVYHDFILTNTAILPLTLNCYLSEPFKIKYNEEILSEVRVPIDVSGVCTLKIQFDPCYQDDLFSRVVDRILTITYEEHPHVDYISLRGEVYFPNLNFDLMELDFGCIMNNSRETKIINIMNKSPMAVKFQWKMYALESSNKLTCEQSMKYKDSKSSYRLKESDTDDSMTPSTPNSVSGSQETEREETPFSGDTEMAGEELTVKGGFLSLNHPDDEDDGPLNESCQAFILLPMDGILNPGENEQIKVTFFGHTNMVARVTAMCEVEGGPTYHVPLSGEASLLNYKFDVKTINYGEQKYDQIAEAEITLTNIGLVGFDFNTIKCCHLEDDKIPPRTPVVVPNMGHIKAGDTKALTVKYLPGLPKKFQSSFNIQVTHFKPETIKLVGIGIFPHLTIDLPRLQEDTFYQKVMGMAKANLCEEMSPNPPENNTEKENEKAEENNQTRPEVILQETELQKEMDRLAVMLYVNDREHECFYLSDLEMPSFLQEQLTVSTSGLGTSRSLRKESAKQWKARPCLPIYDMDFGFIVLGVICTHTICITNSGCQPISFKMEHSHLQLWGFKIDLHKVNQLPPQESVNFVLTFDPRGANLPLGPVETMILINIVNGPQVVVLLHACVTMPDMQISDDILDFGEVKCGECKVVTVQLHNHQQVPSEWSSLPLEDKIKETIKDPLMKLRKKSKSKQFIHKNFEIMPSTGTLLPGQRKNIQVKFMPTEEKSYEGRIPIRIGQSSHRIILLCKGKGLEPVLNFVEEMISYGPILPHSSGDEKEVIVKNPCNFPIEFYSVDFDVNYLEEEKILRLMRGYDEYKILLLPPRAAGEKLPQELLDFYKEKKKKLEEMEKAQKEMGSTVLTCVTEDVAPEQDFKEDGESDQEDADTKADMAESTENLTELTLPTGTGGKATSRDDISTVYVELNDTADKDDDIEDEKLREATDGSGVGELEITPVSASIARYLGIDLSPDGQAARNRRGMAIIVHGSPLSGKTETSVALAKHYDAALLSVDNIVTEAIASGTTTAGIKAREMCAEAAYRRKEEQRLLEEQDVEKKLSTGLGAESVAAFSQVLGSGGPSGGLSTTSIRKISSVMDHKGKITAGQNSTGWVIAGVPGKGNDQPANQVPTSPPPFTYPVAKSLNISPSIGGEDGLVSCVLPEEMLVEILADRMQLNDCHKGIVIDGLESLFSSSFTSLAQVILKAFNNRRYIYFINLKLDYSVFQEKEKKLQEEGEQKKIFEDEQERKWIEEMSEEEYDVMSEEQRAKVEERLMVIKKNRMKRETEEREEKERRERELQEAENRRIDEIKIRKKGKRQSQTQPPEKELKKNVSHIKTSANAEKPSGKLTTAKHDQDARGSIMERPDSQITDRSDTVDGDGIRRKKSGKDMKKALVPDPSLKDKDKGKEEVQMQEETPKEPTKEELALMQRFKIFEASQKEISELIEFWDRTILQTKRPPSPSDKSDAEDHPPPSARRGVRGKDKQAKELEKEKEREKERERKAYREAASQLLGNTESGETNAAEDPEGDKDAKTDYSIGVPHILIDCSDTSVSFFDEIVDMEKLPQVSEVLEGLGLGPKGPPIPPAAIFAVVPYPVKRKAPVASEISKQYVFVASSPDDPNVQVEEKTKEIEPEEIQIAEKEKTERATPASRSRSKADKTKNIMDTSKRKSADKKKPTHRVSQFQIPSPPPGGITPSSDDGLSLMGENIALSEPKTPKLNYFRWVVPANGETVLKVRFSSNDLGQFDQTLAFEITGTRRRYLLFNRGVCAFPTISREPRIVFPHRKKKKEGDEIVHKRYILSSETFEFGPLLVGKCMDSSHPEDRYKEFHENVEYFNITNISPMEAEVNFCFLKDTKAETFLLDPPLMTLASQECKKLAVWAFPRLAKYFDDAVVCCVKDNPEPIIYQISCEGFRPELELDKKVFQFDKVLILREEMRIIHLRNRTKLPVAWKLTGMEHLGEEFTVTALNGIVEPLSEAPLNAFFQAKKPVTITKKQVKLEISDVENIVKATTEQINILAEAYDVAVDISFPRGIATDDERRLDFGTVKVSEDSKQALTLKNKGKYEILYEILLNSETDRSFASMFTVTPNKGTLGPLDRPATCQVSFKTNNEITIKDQTIYRCQVIDPAGDVLVATLPIKISVRAVFSKFLIAPDNDINFGSLMVTAKKTRTITIENKGDFEFKYTISKMVRDKEISSMKNKRANEPPPAMRLTLGIFNISPAYGSVSPGSQQPVLIECVGDNLGVSSEELSIDISERNPQTYPHGISYFVQAECCAPAICIDDVGAIFEEHRICKSLSLWQHYNQVDSGGVYGETEKKFMFSNVIVGKKSKARFKIINNSKVPCDVNFAVKAQSARGSGRQQQQQEVFDVEPTKAQILNHSHIFVTVTFAPLAMQMYNTIFEAFIDSSGLPIKTESLTFEISGEGTLPRISVSRPTIRNQQGQPVLLFKQNLVGNSQTLRLALTNDVSLPCEVELDLMDPDEVFTIQPAAGTNATMGLVTQNGKVTKKRPHTASVALGCCEQAVFEVTFQPKKAIKSQGQVQLTIYNNQYENTLVRLVGEGYFEEVTLDNIYLAPHIEQLVQAEVLDSCQIDNMEAAKANLMAFGDCYIGEAKTQSLTITNRCQQDCIHFQWPTKDPLSFSPQVGHLQPGQAKDIILIFNAAGPVCLQEDVIKCTVKKISFEKPLSEIPDWDDRIHVIKWIDVEPVSVSSRTGSAIAVAITQKGTNENSVRTSSQSKGCLATASVNLSPRKRKVVEIEPEPACNVVPESERSIELLVSGTADFCKYSCKTDNIHFKDTLMFQIRTFRFHLKNTGNIQLDYNWQIVMDNFRTTDSLTAAAAADKEPQTSPVSSPDTYIPFSIEPAFGTIAAGGKCVFTVKYSPLNTTECSGHIICSIPNLEANIQGPSIGIKGKSLMPYCHFEVDDSDYIRSSRRDPKRRGPGGAPPSATLDINTRVIEMECVGLYVYIQKKFSILNPTNEMYSYEWILQDESHPKNFTGFTCLTPKGSVRPGKKAEMAFEFTSQEPGIAESFWQFQISQQNICVPFLLVANVKDPDILLDRSHLTFKPLLINHQSVETVFLVNNEASAFKFAFSEDSCFSGGIPSSLVIEPMKGSVAANSRLAISFHFTPLSHKIVNFNVICKVTGKLSTLQLNIKGEGYSMNCAALCENMQGVVMEFTKTGINEIDFSEVEVNEKSTRTVTISNTGKFHFNYEWILNERATQMLEILPLSGGVTLGSKDTCIVSFCPTSKVSLTGCKMSLKISNGPNYQIFVTGIGVYPGLQFSFLSYNFGYCFIHKEGMVPKVAELRVTNKDTKDISLDCLYSVTRQLMHNFKPTNIEPGKHVDIVFSFYPREPIKYNERITFQVNGLSTQNVQFLGQGTEMKVEVADSKNKIVKLGAQQVGSVVKRTVAVVNRTPAAVTFSVVCSPNCSHLKQSGVLSISPTSAITLPANNGVINIQVVFSPKSRIPQFSEEISLERAGVYQPLFVIKGYCLAMEVSLESDYIPFGAVVLQSSSIRKLVLTNSGDINAKIRWDVERFKPDFSIFPIQSHIIVGKQVVFDVTFKPQKIQHDIRYENLACYVNEGEYPSLMLTLTGTCIGTPTTRDVQNFQTYVRQKDTKNLSISNKTNQAWELRPIIDGNYWQGPLKFCVEPQTTKNYDITYKPMRMTGPDGKKHTGSIFFPLPDGTAIFYNLLGIADPPKPNEKIQRDVPCKTKYMELLSVVNWCKQTLRFKVKRELMKAEKVEQTTLITGMDYINVPASGQKDYRLEFHAYKEGTSNIKVIFTHTETGEYQFYELTIRATKSGSLDTIELVTPVRTSARHTIKLENPLASSVNFNFNTNIAELMIPPSPLSIPEQSEGEVTIEYQPIKIGEATGKLELVSSDLGLYLYELNLKATPAGPEKAIYMRVALGQNCVQVARFLNYTKQRTDYICKVNNTDFHVDKSVAAAPASPSGTEIAVDVTFEPSRLGEQRALLTVSSTVGGEYTFPLFGICTPPKPQGPYIIKSGATICIVFRNVFSTNTTFTFQVDNELFHLPKQQESIRPHKDYRVIVGFDGNDSPSKAEVMGKLIISCPRVAADVTNLQWLYYLKGVTV